MVGKITKCQDVAEMSQRSASWGSAMADRMYIFLLGCLVDGGREFEFRILFLFLFGLSSYLTMASASSFADKSSSQMRGSLG